MIYGHTKVSKKVDGYVLDVQKMKFKISVFKVEVLEEKFQLHTEMYALEIN